MIPALDTLWFLPIAANLGLNLYREARVMNAREIVGRTLPFIAAPRACYTVASGGSATPPDGYPRHVLGADCKRRLSAQPPPPEWLTMKEPLAQHRRLRRPLEFASRLADRSLADDRLSGSATY
jgi:hypothetical protein